MIIVGKNHNPAKWFCLCPWCLIHPLYAVLFIIVYYAILPLWYFWSILFAVVLVIRLKQLIFLLILSCMNRVKKSLSSREIESIGTSLFVYNFAISVNVSNSISSSFNNLVFSICSSSLYQVPEWIPYYINHKLCMNYIILLTLSKNVCSQCSLSPLQVRLNHL